MTLVPGSALPMVGAASVVFTGCDAGDLGSSSGDPRSRRRDVVDLPWVVPTQVHGAVVVDVDGPHVLPGDADALVSACPGIALAVLTADCAPVALSSPQGVIGVAHAGWRGLVAGVVERTAEAMRRLGATDIEAVVGPCIHPCCYRFGTEDLAQVTARLGDEVASLDSDGHPALDVPAGVRRVLATAGVDTVTDVGRCTACGGGLWSWRARQDRQRQATVVWR